MTGDSTLHLNINNRFKRRQANDYLPSQQIRSHFNTPSDIEEYRAALGHLGRLDEPIGAEVTRNIAGWVRTFETHLAVGTLKPIEYQVVDGVGWDKVIQGIQELESGNASKKVVVRTQEK